MSEINDGDAARPEPNYGNHKHVWFPVISKHFSVEVKCWKYAATDEEWRWNVYAHIFDTHPLFSDPGAAIETLHLHGGCSFDQIKTVEPALGIRYDWQRITKSLTVGSDYSHYCDDYYQSCDPADGVPGSIKSNVAELVEQLHERIARSQP